MMKSLSPFKIILGVLMFGNLSCAARHDPEANLLTQSDLSGSNALAFSIYPFLEQGSNSVFSPYSIYNIGTTLFLATKGETANEIESVLKIPKKDPLNSLALSNQRLGHLKENKNYLTIANSLWLRQNPNDYRFLETEFIDPLEKDLGTTVKAVNFDTENFRNKAIDEMNQWINKSTEGQIDASKNPPITSQMVTSQTSLIAINTVATKASWITPFAVLHKEQRFHSSKGQDQAVKMMNQTFLSLNYFKNKTLNYQAVEVPLAKFSAKAQMQLALLIVLPDRSTDFSLLNQNFLLREYDELRANLSPMPIRLTMPLFKLKSRTDLAAILKKAGVLKAFDPIEANFRGMVQYNDEPPKTNVFLSAVKHDAVMEVNEQGISAAAVTVAATYQTVSLPLEPEGLIDLRIDRSFSVFLVEKESGTIIFRGSILSIE